MREEWRGRGLAAQSLPCALVLALPHGACGAAALGGAAGGARSLRLRAGMSAAASDWTRVRDPRALCCLATGGFRMRRARASPLSGCRASPWAEPRASPLRRDARGWGRGAMSGVYQRKRKAVEVHNLFSHTRHKNRGHDMKRATISITLPAGGGLSPGKDSLLPGASLKKGWSRFLGGTGGHGAGGYLPLAGQGPPNKTKSCRVSGNSYVPIGGVEESSLNQPTWIFANCNLWSVQK